MRTCRLAENDHESIVNLATRTQNPVHQAMAFESAMVRLQLRFPFGNLCVFWDTSRDGRRGGHGPRTRNTRGHGDYQYERKRR